MQYVEKRISFGIKMQFPINNPVIVIVGPTASGKSKLAVDLAVKLDAEIVSADSRYFYRGMDIGTAKPTFDEMKGIPHHLIDIADPDQVISLGEFKIKVLNLIDFIHERKKPVVVVGGSGQYIRSVLEGWTVPEVAPNIRLRMILTEWANEIGVAKLHDKLCLIDQVAADSIDYRNVRRTIRALEVIFLTGKHFSQLRKMDPKLPFHYKIIGLTYNRLELYRRIDTRIQNMIQLGMIDEVKKLKDRWGMEYPAMSAIGYREIAAYLDGKYDLDTAVSLIKKRTRSLVRRQANWFKTSDQRIKWFEAGGNTLDHIIRYIESEEGWS